MALDKKTISHLLVLPLITVLLFVLVWPLIRLGDLSLRGVNVGVQGYVRILTSPRFLRSLWNTFSVSVASTSLGLFFCMPAAIFIESPSRSRAERFLKRTFVVVLSIPLSLPGIVIGFFIILFFGNTGLVPQVFEIVAGERRLQIAYSVGGILMGYVYFLIPRIILVIRGAVAKLSWETIDVARTLGASPFLIYGKVIFPALSGALLSAASLSIATAFGAFGTAATLSRGFKVVPLEIAAAFTENFQPETASAMSVILTAIVVTALLGLGGLGRRTRETT